MTCSSEYLAALADPLTACQKADFELAEVEAENLGASMRSGLASFHLNEVAQLELALLAQVPASMTLHVAVQTLLDAGSHAQHDLCDTARLGNRFPSATKNIIDICVSLYHFGGVLTSLRHSGVC